ncbi:MAG TPA: SpoIIE family protein phosphatase, partial [Thermoguttaceae bacterium]|nr:SpoIIE family protein phosphatase [Thermoguttaceae bacterium]
MIENTVNILLVEDEEAHAELFRRAFAARAPQVHVTVAGSLQEAQICLTQHRPDLMITDIVLPDGKGTDLLPADKQSPPFPIVVITSHGNEQMAVDAMKAGAANYITKSDTALAKMPEVAEQALREWQQLVREKDMEEARRKANAELERLVHQRTAELEDANAGLKEKIRQLEQAEQRFRQLLESAPDAMVITDRTGQIVLINAQAETLFGHSREEMLGQSVEMLLPESFREKHIQLREGYFATPRMRRMEAGLELQAVRKNGEHFPVEIALSPLETEDGILVSSAIRDLTQRKRVERELRDNQAQLLAAQRIQACLLPSAPPNLPGFDIAGASYPAEFAAGDYFDYLTISDESLGLVIADVSGHGFAPALLMASTHALLQSLAHTNCELGTILMQANRFLARETELDRYVTLLLGRLDPANRSFVYASAGHTPGFLLNHSGDVKRRLESTSLPLAVMPDIEFPACDPIHLESGDMILLLTDGFHEA